MRKTHVLRSILVAMATLMMSLQAMGDDYNGIQVSTSAGGFPVVSEGTAATIVVDKEEAEVVHIAADALSKDIRLLTGITPQLADAPASGTPSIYVGTLGSSETIDALARAGLVDSEAVTGKWETFCLTTVTIDGRPALVIYGSDPRGTAFGIFELSRAMGVTPFVWWADVTPEHRDNLYVTTAGTVVGPPSVKYRGIFINDEDWGLQPWAANSLDTDIEDIGPRTYEKVFELMLRLKSNYLWPAMHPCTKAFWYYKENAEVARRYQIVLGASHCEPLLRNNVDEWSNNFVSEYGKESGDWNWKTNSANIKQYWTDRVIESKENDAIYTMGMRGIHDSSMPGYSTNEEKRVALKEVIATQRDILSTHLEKDAADVPQLFCPYKEALTLYRLGLDLADDITLLWADDNFGYIRQLSNPEEQLRSGGGGVYYHFSYWGVPCDHLWLSSVSPTLTSYELRKAYDLNCKDVWIFNVGDIKPHEVELQFAMDYSWDVERWNPEKAYSYLEAWAAEYFGESLAEDIAAVRNEYYRLAAAGKPEHVHAINYPREEVEQRLADYTALEQAVNTLQGSIPARLSDAFYQLVYYPVMGAVSINKKVLYAKMSFYAAQEGNKALTTEYATLAFKAYETIVDITRRYNTEIAGGKWNRIMDHAPRGLSYFYEPTVATATSASATPVPADNSTKTVRIGASEYTASGNSSDLQVIEGLGISDRSVTVLPLNLTAYTADDITSAPYVEYKVATTAGTNTITVKCLPSFPIHSGYRLRFATSLNGATPQFHDITLEAETSPWSTYVMTGYSLSTLTYECEANEDITLRIYLADPGVVVSEIEVEQPKSNVISGLVNPGFEYKSEGVANNGAVTRGDPWGWKRTGTILKDSYGISSDATGYEGTSICWYNSTPMPDTFEMYQTLEGLEAGTYLVRCKLGVFSGTVTNQRLFANQSVQYYGSESDYVSNRVEGETATFAGHAWGVTGGSKGQLYEMAVYVTLAEGESLKVGIRSSNKKSDGSTATNNSGWFKVDDFRIEKVDEVIPDTPDESDDTYTSKLSNPNFEYIAEGVSYTSGTTRGVPYGWKVNGTLTGNSYGINADGTGYEGNALCWIASVPMPEDFQLYQEVEDFPAGHYTVTCKMANFTNLVTTQRVFANKYVSYFGREEDYALNLSEEELPSWNNWSATDGSLLKPMTLDFYLFPDETLTIGVRSDNRFADGTVTTTTNAGWFKIDNFEITYHGNDINDFVAHVTSLREQAALLAAIPMDGACLDALEAASQAAEGVTAATAMADIKEHTDNLIDCLAAARISIAFYRNVREQLDAAESTTSQLDESYDDAAYAAVTEPIKTAYENGTLDNATDYSTRIKNAVHAAIKSQYNQGADMTAVLAGTSSLEGWTVTGGNTVQVNTWSTEGNSDGTNMRTPFIEDWLAGTSATPLSDATLQTKVSGLHPGVYSISALVRVYREYSSDAAFTGASLFANDMELPVTDGNTCMYNTKRGVYGTYRLRVIPDENGTITFGIHIKDATFNWLAMKNFTLTYEGSEEALASSVTLEVTESRFATFMAPFDICQPEGVTAYKVNGVDNNSILILQDVGACIAANSPVVLFSETPVSRLYSGVSLAAADAYTGGLLTGVYKDTQAPSGTYLLQDQEGVTGFYRVEDNEGLIIPPYRCYLQGNSQNINARRYLFDESLTGIRTVGILQEEKIIAIHTLDGKKTHSLVRGLNLVSTESGKTIKVYVEK